MADISKITVGGVTYDVKDETARKTSVYIGPDQPTDGTMYWLDTSASAEEEVMTYTVTLNLTNATTDNSATTANKGKSYAATITANEGCALSSVVVTMGGTDITGTNYADGNIYIAAVTGDIVITAVAEEVPEDSTVYTVTNNLVNVSSNNNAVSVEENASYTATLTADDGYTLEGAAVTITMGGVNITTEVYADGVVAIPAVTGDVVISVSGAEYIGEPVSMTFSAGLKGFSSYYSDDGVTPMEKTPRDRGGFYSDVFEVDTKITASFVVADYQNACYGYGLWSYIDETSRFYGGVYCAPGKHEITITVPAGNRFMIMGTYESHCTNVVVNGKEV